MILASSDEPDILARGVMVKSIPAMVARSTTHVLCVRNADVGKNEAPYCAKAETSKAEPNKKNKEANSMGVLWLSLRARRCPTSSMTEVSALLQMLKVLAKGTRARSIITHIA